ncbi:MAG: hypothetical protein QW291_07145 [Thermofilaceae archaeon]
MPGLLSYGAPLPAPAAALEVVKEGVLTADGTEQELVAAVGLAEYYGLISLDRMTVGDKVAVSLYVRMTADGEWKRYRRMEYAGPQEDPVLHLLVKVARHGFRVTLHQFEGVPKTFEYCFYKKL